jgi:hypothetical protein
MLQTVLADHAVRIDFAQQKGTQSILFIRPVEHPASLEREHLRRGALKDDLLLRVADAEKVAARRVRVTTRRRASERGREGGRGGGGG